MFWEYLGRPAGGESVSQSPLKDKAFSTLLAKTYQLSYCRKWISLPDKVTTRESSIRPRRRRAGLRVTSEMSESGRKTAVSHG
jgi:hypothetical protein